MKMLVLSILPFIFLSCGDKMVRGPSSASNQAIDNECACTFEWKPVCGENGKTYDNECTAKCLGAKIARAGKCECDENSGPVCGQPPMPKVAPGQMQAQVMPQPQTYDNECLLLEDEATMISKGDCP